MQFRFNGAMMTALFIGMTITICIGGYNCVNYATTWLGNPPVAFIFTSLQVSPPTHSTLSSRFLGSNYRMTCNENVDWLTKEPCVGSQIQPGHS